MELLGIVLIVLTVACAAGPGAVIGRMVSIRDAGQDIPGRILAAVGPMAVAAAGIVILVVSR